MMNAYPIIAIAGKRIIAIMEMPMLNAIIVTPKIPPLLRDCQSQLPATKWKEARSSSNSSRLIAVTVPDTIFPMKGSEVTKDEETAPAAIEVLRRRRNMLAQTPATPIMKKIAEPSILAIPR